MTADTEWDPQRPRGATTTRPGGRLLSAGLGIVSLACVAMALIHADEVAAREPSALLVLLCCLVGLWLVAEVEVLRRGHER